MQRNMQAGFGTSESFYRKNYEIGREESSLIKKIQYWILVGKLMYLSHTKPNTVYSVSVVNRFMHDPKEKTHASSGQKFSGLEVKLRKGTTI